MSPDPMTSGWYYAKAGAAQGREVGPLSWEELYLLTRDGTLSPEDLVWNPKLPQGIAAGTVPGLFSAPPVTDAQPTQLPVYAEPAPATPETGQQAQVAQPQTESWAGALSSDGIDTTRLDTITIQSPAGETGKQGNRLPMLVVLLAAVVAAGGLVAYFLFFRDSLIDQESGIQTAATVVRAVLFGL